MVFQSLLPYSRNQAWEETIAALEDWTKGKPARALFRISPPAVAQELSLDEGLATDVFLAGVLEGWFELRWDFHCPHCQGIPHITRHLHDAVAEGSCPACNVEFRNQLDANVEVTFSAAPRLAVFADGEQEKLLDEYHRSMGAKQGTEKARTLTGLGLLHRPFFHERFSDEVLSVEESLEIRQVVFLFTDIKGSTQLYEQLGDAKAYNLVRRHFTVLFDAIEALGGIVVKTIGDAVMASFRSGADAVKAALAVHEAVGGILIPGTEEAVVVKMGLHAGPAIAVTMNEQFDYFGQTVNKAARIQNLAKNQEIYFSEALFQDPSVRRILAGRKAAVRRWKTQLKGIAGDQTVYSIN